MKKDEKNKKHEENKGIEKKNLEFENLENQLKRALADYQNLEKRVIDEKSTWVKIANKDLLLKLLPGLDNLILAEKHTQDEGVRISIKHFLQTFEQIGVKKIETVGLSFNPEFMEAVATREGAQGKVIEEIRAGYTIFDIILRPSQVIVGSAEQNQEL